MPHKKVMLSYHISDINIFSYFCGVVWDGGVDVRHPHQGLNDAS